MESSQMWPKPQWSLARGWLAEVDPLQGISVGRAAALLATGETFFGEGSNTTELASAVAALHDGVGNEEEARRATHAAARLDGYAFTLREKAEEEGDHTGGDAYAEAFARARSAASVAAALGGDAPRAVYEARYALKDDQQLFALVARLTGHQLPV